MNEEYERYKLYAENLRKEKRRSDRMTWLTVAAAVIVMVIGILLVLGIVGCLES